MLPSDGMTVGQPLISGGYFSDPVFESDFSTMSSLSLPDPNNHMNTGMFSDQQWAGNIGLLGTWWVDWSPNDQTEKLVTTLNPTPDNFNPFTLIPGDGLRIRGEEIPAGLDHQEWGYAKRYDRNPDSSYRTTDQIPGFPNYNVSWLTNPPVEGVDYVLEPQTSGPDAGKTRILYLKYPQRWRAGMLTTRNNRASVTQSRAWFVVKQPVGSENDGSGRNNWQYRSCTFPAMWLYGQVKPFRNRNDEPRSGSGLYPYNDGGSLNEIDVSESSGRDPDLIYHAFHIHEGHDYDFIRNYTESAQDNLNKQTRLTNAVDDYHVYVVDITPEKMGIAVGRLGEVPTYRRVISSKRYIYETKRHMLTDAQDDRLMVRNSLGELIATKEQIGDDGKPKLQEFQLIMNIAFDGQWLLDQFPNTPAGTETPYAQLPDGRKYADMFVKSCGIQHLVGARFIRPDGSLYMPYRDLTPATTNPWDGSAVAPIPAPTLTGTDG